MSKRSVYSCHSDTAGPVPRGRKTEQLMQDGWVHVTGSEGQATREPVMRKVVTDWTAMRCGALQQSGKPQDINCSGCANWSGPDGD